jgi:hypothetical protein
MNDADARISYMSCSIHLYLFIAKRKFEVSNIIDDPMTNISFRACGWEC